MKVTTKTSLCKWKDGKMLIAFFHAVLSTKAEPDLVTVKPNAEIICWDHPTPPPLHPSCQGHVEALKSR